MISFDTKTDTSSSAAHSDLSSTLLRYSSDSSPFLNWNEEELESEHDRAIVFWSLVTTLKLQHALDDSLEAKAVELLKSVIHKTTASADAFLNSFGRTADESSTNFIHSIVVLLSSGSQTIIMAAMKILDPLIHLCSAKSHLPLVQANLIPQLINTINPLSLSLTEVVDIHTGLMTSIARAAWLAAPYSLALLQIEDGNEQQAVHETVLKQVLAPSEQYIRHLCVNRYSIVDAEQSRLFLALLARLLRICPYYQPFLTFVLALPVVLTIPSYLTFFEYDRSIGHFLYFMVEGQREWNETIGNVRQMWKIVLRMLRTEGFDDVIEEKLQINKNSLSGRIIIQESIELNNG
ncbi:hypothetical protein BLNAU_7127 [Blattamonas nauphoetae]|uniref:Uncharacterized protein n=1 Tax=Blattamonas nauphoetae TaxID=2049346 RepID=A0ABQ9Y2J7_9EUKA|nr:hypothetical protein BLNAU_7127 [Blattamonas nauphoetae]